ncbi:MAG: DUF1275 family protein [Streptococcaceae bacterium]|jgi:uncharacterized membrane protein YoaK (UPF0700 family)|nr:DUF1275 family protein [Streptococcaceae bacterium]
MKENTTKLETYLTVLAIFLMGYLDAYSMNFLDNAIISAQTGNLSKLIGEIAQGNWLGTLPYLGMLLGFAAGCVGAYLLSAKLYGTMKSWFVFSMFIYVITIFHPFISKEISMMLLSCATGIALTFFKNMNGLEALVGIQTGNLKRVWVGLTDLFVFKNHQNKNVLIKVVIVVGLFSLGSLIGHLLLPFGNWMMLVVASGICFLGQVVYPIWANGN